MHKNEREGLIQMLVKSDRNMTLADQGFHLKEEQAQRRVAGDRSGRKCSKKYVFLAKIWYLR